MKPKTEWVLCPFCHSKTRTQIREDTVLINYPLFCPKCKHISLVNAKGLKIQVISNAMKDLCNK